MELYTRHGTVDWESCYQWLQQHPGTTDVPNSHYAGWNWMSRSRNGDRFLNIAALLAYVEARYGTLVEHSDRLLQSRIGLAQALLDLADELELQAEAKRMNDHATRPWKARAVAALESATAWAKEKRIRRIRYGIRPATPSRT